MKIPKNRHDNFLTKAINKLIDQTYVQQLRYVEAWMEWHRDYYPDFDINNVEIVTGFDDNKHYVLAYYYKNQEDMEYSIPYFSYGVILTAPALNDSGGAVAEFQFIN